MSVDHTKNIIEIKNVTFSYGPKIPVLEKVNLNVHKGDYLGVIGPNGGGKTTLLKVMLGLLTPEEGEVIIFGEDVRKFSDWWRVGYVPQKAINFDVNFPATVYEVVAMGRYGKKGLFRGLNKEDRRVVIESLKQVEMEEYKDKVVGDLSGGQQQRVFIARALAAKPEVIFLDEPTAGVDVLSQDNFYELLRKLNRELEITLVLVSHDVEAVVKEVTEIAFVNRKLSYDSDPKKMTKHELKHLYGERKFIHTHEHH